MSAIAVGAPRAEAASLFTGHPWEALPPLLDRAPSAADVRAHRLELLHAALLRERGAPVPPELAQRARTAQLATLSSTALLKRIRDLCSGPILVLKGPEIAARYPALALRPFGDIDLLVPDPVSVQRRLEEAGFVGIGEWQDWDALHHLRRLASPDGLFAVEIHKRPKWVDGLPVPSVDDLLVDAVPSATGVEDVLAPSPPAHAVLLAAHAWAERSLECIGDLVDITAMTGDQSAEAEAFAARFDLDRVWEATTSASAALFGGGVAGWQLRTWARHLEAARGQTVLESHLERLLVPFSTLPGTRAPGTAARAVARTVLRRHDESWRRKLARAARALRNAFLRRSEHEERLRRDDEGM